MRKRLRDNKALLIGIVLVMVAVSGVVASVAVASPRTISHIFTGTSTSNGGHYVLGPSGYSLDHDTLIVAGSQVPTLSDGDHVVICHALGEDNKDTYNQIAPSTGVVFGHAGQSHQLGEDIIPPFRYDSNSGHDVNNSLINGQNWDAAHIAIYNNGCNVPGTTTTGTTSTGTTSTGTTSTGTTGTTTTTPGTTVTGPTTTVPGGTVTGPSSSVPGQTVTGPSSSVPGQTTTGPTVSVPGTTVTGPTTTVPGKVTTTPNVSKTPQAPPKAPKKKPGKVPAPPTQGFTR